MKLASAFHEECHKNLFHQEKLKLAPYHLPFYEVSIISNVLSNSALVCCGKTLIFLC